MSSRLESRAAYQFSPSLLAAEVVDTLFPSFLEEVVMGADSVAEPV